MPAFDADAVGIGELYRAGRGSFIAAAEALLKAGRRLIAKKESMRRHGDWLPWLEANAEALGFSTDRTAQRLMKIAKEIPTSGFDKAKALQISRADLGQLASRKPRRGGGRHRRQETRSACSAQGGVHWRRRR